MLCIKEDSFYQISDASTIYVPLESLEAYNAADGWSDFAMSIQPYDFFIMSYLVRKTYEKDYHHYLTRNVLLLVCENIYWDELLRLMRRCLQTDHFWGETKTDSQIAKEALMNSRGYRIETLNAEDISLNSATVHGYVAPESLTPLGNPDAQVKYGIIVYNLMDTSQRQFCEHMYGEGGEISMYCDRLKSGTLYAYFTFYSDLTNAIVRFADPKVFLTKGEMMEEDYMGSVAKVCV